MKKIIIMFLSALIMISSTSCSSTNVPAKGETEKNKITEQKETDDNIKGSTSAPIKKGVAPTSKPEQLTQSVAISNAIIVEDNHKDNIVYKEKCDTCGYISPGTISSNPGSFTSGFYCPNCKENKVIKIQTSDIK